MSAIEIIGFAAAVLVGALITSKLRDSIRRKQSSNNDTYYEDKP